MGWPPLPPHDWSENPYYDRRDKVTLIDKDETISQIPDDRMEHEQARDTILDHASTQIRTAELALRAALQWYGIIDTKDYSPILREVEKLRDTIDYRASL